jgi:uncharacterized protein YgbK (DUF1537 family)
LRRVCRGALPPVQGETFAITLKSGNFGAEDFFAKALSQLDT